MIHITSHWVFEIDDLTIISTTSSDISNFCVTKCKLDSVSASYQIFEISKLCESVAKIIAKYYDEYF